MSLQKQAIFKFHKSYVTIVYTYVLVRFLLLKYSFFSANPHHYWKPNYITNYRRLMIWVEWKMMKKQWKQMKFDHKFQKITVPTPKVLSIEWNIKKNISSFKIKLQLLGFLQTENNFDRKTETRAKYWRVSRAVADCVKRFPND